MAGCTCETPPWLTACLGELIPTVHPYGSQGSAQQDSGFGALRAVDESPAWKGEGTAMVPRSCSGFSGRFHLSHPCAAPRAVPNPKGCSAALGATALVVSAHRVEPCR